MKILLVVAVMMSTVSSCFAYSSDGYSHVGHIGVGILFLIILVPVIWFILNVILFFKIWGMTNNIKDIMQKINHLSSRIDALYSSEVFSTTNPADLRRNALMGNIDNVKKTLFTLFCNQVESSFNSKKTFSHYKDENGKRHLANLKEQNLKESIRPFIENLEVQFHKIDEEIPSYIKKMVTYEDYFNLFQERENTPV